MLMEAREAGFLGPGDTSVHIDRALDLAAVLDHPPATALDLGSGGGVPGLPLALVWPASQWVLLDGSRTRASFLDRVLRALGLADRVTVIGERAEVAGHGEFRGTLDLVVARGLGPPGPTAECGAPFLRVGGQLAVAEPPGGQPERWDAGGLDELGLRALPQVDSPTRYQIMRQERPCPARYPRRVGVPNKRPLF